MRDIAIAALKAGKHVYCEKPLAADLGAAEEMAAAASRAKGKTLVGYNYMRSPAIAFAKQLITDGAIGQVSYFRGVCDEDYMADAETPYSWRCRRDMAGLGALGDLASHLVSIAHDLIGPVAPPGGRHAHRHPQAPGAGRRRRHRAARRQGRARAASIARSRTRTPPTRWCSSTTASWARWSPAAPIGAASRISGSKCSARRARILFDHERMNELQIYTKDATDARDQRLSPDPDRAGASVLRPLLARPRATASASTISRSSRSRTCWTASRARKRSRPPSPTRWRSRRCCTASSRRPRAGRGWSCSALPPQPQCFRLDARFGAESGCDGCCGWLGLCGCCGCDCAAGFSAGLAPGFSTGFAADDCG